MALPPMELRYRSSAVYFILTVSGFIFVVLVGSLFLSPPIWQTYLAEVPAILLMLYVTTLLVRKYRSDLPILIFESHALTVNDRKARMIPWSAITEWKISTYKNSHHLIIRTSSEKTKVEISWLQVNTATIRSLMETYIRQPGPRL
jgi:hypothetical protein